MKKVLLTGDRPSGPLHLGHYVGSLQNRVRLQAEYESYILIADTQALTDNFKNPDKVKEHVMDLMADYLAAGLDPKVSTIFLQSKIRGLYELTQYLSNLVTFDSLKHNPTLKTELAQKKINNMGFINYPISQAADILGFKGELVPVGQDQSPILELTNKIRKQFNQLYGKDFFPPVQGLYSETSRLQGINGSNKMSKSLDNAIYLKDSKEVIAKKVKSMYTDPLHLRVEDPGHLEGNVVVYFLEVFDPDKVALEKLKEHYVSGGLADSVLKQRLIEVLEEVISPMRQKREELVKNPDYLKQVLLEGTNRANEKVESTMELVREIFSLKLD